MTNPSSHISESTEPIRKSKHLPLVAIIGRPNVGKSTFVNRIIGLRKAIVDDLPGVTRDRVYYDAEWLGRPFQIMDTGGLIPGSEDSFDPQVNAQVIQALKEADIIICLVDGPAGITPLDEGVAQRVRESGKPYFLAVNKIDKKDHMAYIAEFYSLGLNEPYPVSAMHGTVAVGDLLDKIIETFPEKDEDSSDDPPIHIAFVGRPNVGKSSIVNALIGEDRTIVSDIPGTTRDAINLTLTHEGKDFVLVDTAGIRKKKKVDYGVEAFSVERSIKAIKEANVTVLVFDVTEGITDQDKKIVETSNEAGTGLVLVANKWDLVEGKDSNSVKKYQDDLGKEIPHLKYAKMVFTSALTKQRLTKIYELAEQAHQNNNRRVQTSVLNQVIMDAATFSPPPAVKGKRMTVKYATQVSNCPPHFVIFVNDVKLFKESYRRYLENRIRDSFDFTGTPILIRAKNRGK